MRKGRIPLKMEGLTKFSVSALKMILELIKTAIGFLLARLPDLLFVLLLPFFIFFLLFATAFRDVILLFCPKKQKAKVRNFIEEKFVLLLDKFFPTRITRRIGYKIGYFWTSLLRFQVSLQGYSEELEEGLVKDKQKKGMCFMRGFLKGLEEGKSQKIFKGEE